VCFIVVVYGVNLYIIIIVTQRGGFRKVKVWVVSVRDGDATKISRVNCEWYEEKRY